METKLNASRKKLGRSSLLLAIAVLGCGAPESRPPTATERVGTYHAPSLVIAWVRSAEHARELDALVAARDAAKKAGDEAKVAECERTGGQRQDLAHRQLAGEAGVEDILARLKADLPSILESARVDRLVADTEPLEEGIERVDLTELLVERFHPDEATRKLLAEARKHGAGVHVH
jgi:hypothetical protein